ncbi:acyl-CoA dehydrogenase family protein [Pikeienuella sp. HZG-20]|uniref:acyl-CoA dehydrogenase family protein n=1 Tax=Paludibacillus litoralis TaxID=3133267 RepID=UPI0030EF14ED
MTRQDYDAFREVMRRLAVEKVAPHAAEVDKTRKPPLKAYEAFRDAGLLALPFAESLGGQEGDLMSQVIAVEEMARVCGTSGLTLMTGWAALDPLVRFGAPELIEKIVPSLAAGDTVAAWCLTEPQGGSDLPSLKTKAERDGDDWVINGVKRFITNATWADWYLVLARTGEKAYGIFMVHRDDPGISFGKLEAKMGLRGSPTADVIFDNCRIPASRAVGDTTMGYKHMMVSLTISRPLIAAQALGIAQGALDQAVSYTRDRKQFGQSISRFQLLRGMIADMAVKIESSRLLLHRAVEAIEADPTTGRTLASMAKLLCSDTAMSVTTDAVQLHGGYGYLEDYPVERMMRDAKITQIYEGTNQIQRMIIAKSVYGD